MRIELFGQIGYNAFPLQQRRTVWKPDGDRRSSAIRRYFFASMVGGIRQLAAGRTLSPVFHPDTARRPYNKKPPFGGLCEPVGTGSNQSII